MQGFGKTFLIAFVIHAVIIGVIILMTRSRTKDDVIVEAPKEEPKVVQKVVTSPPAVPQPPVNKIRFPLKGHKSVQVAAPVPKVDAVKEAPKAQPPKAPIKIVEVDTPKIKEVEPPRIEQPKKVPVKIGKRIEGGREEPPAIETPKKIPVKIGKRIEAPKPKAQKSIVVKPKPTISEQIESRGDELDAWLKGRERVPVQTTQSETTSLNEPPAYNY